MDYKTLKSLVDLKGNQRVEATFSSIKKEERDTIDVETLLLCLTKPSGSYIVKPILEYLSEVRPEGWTSTAYFLDRGGGRISINPAEPCHRYVSFATEETTFFAQFYPDNPSLKYVLSMFADDGPFESVVQDVSFVPVKNGVFAVFRNMNIPAKVFTNFLIWTRSFYQYRADIILAPIEEAGLTRKEVIALAPVFSSRRSRDGTFAMTLNINYGDMPVYMTHRETSDYRGGYHPNDYIKGNANTKRYDLTRRVGGVLPNPCNGYLSLRKKDYCEYTTIKESICSAKLKDSEVFLLLKESLNSDSTLDEAYAKLFKKEKE